jgi:hypothetical protein
MLQKLSFHPGGVNLLLLPGFKELGSFISSLTALQEQELSLSSTSASTSPSPFYVLPEFQQDLKEEARHD